MFEYETNKSNKRTNSNLLMLNQSSTFLKKLIIFKENEIEI